MRLLIVDDDARMRSSLQYMFERSKHNVVSAGSRDEAIRVVDDDGTSPDVVLVDYYFDNAPAGPAIAQAIRHRNKRCIIFMYSAATDALPVPPGQEVLAHFAKDIGTPDEARAFTQSVVRKVEETLSNDESRLTRIKRFEWDEGLFRYLVAKLGTGLDIIAPDYRVIYCNERFLQIVGLPADWVPPADSTCWEVYHGHTKRTGPCRGCVVQDVFRTGQPQQRVVANPVRGSLTFFEVSAVPLFTEDGRTYAVVETIADETERMKVRFLSWSFHEAGWGLDARLKEAAMRFDELGMSQAVFFLYDSIAGRFYQRCPRDRQPSSECVENCDIRVDDPDVARLLKSADDVPIRRIERQGRQEVLALLRTGIAGAAVPVGLVRASDVRQDIPEQLQVQLVRLVAETISECNQHETALARSHAAEAMRELDVKCAHATNLPEALAHLIEVLVEHVNADMGHVRLLNPLRTLERVASAGVFQDCIVQIEDPGEDDSAAARAFTRREPYVVRHTAADSVFLPVQGRLRKQGIAEYVVREFADKVKSYAAVPIMLTADKPFGTSTCTGTIFLGSSTCGFFTGEKIAVMEDFANRAADLIYRYRFITRKEEAWREFSQIAAHRVGNQVSALGGLLDVLAEDVAKQPVIGGKWVERLQIMRECVATAKRMLADQTRLLQHISLHLEPTPLADLVRRSVASAVPPTAHLTIRDATEPVLAKVDRALMSEVFQELATNAVRAAGDHVDIVVGICPTMGALPTRDGDSPIARVEFFNRGPSLSDEVLKRVFQPGFSADKQRRGLGLGLAIARRFVEAHGGSIVAEPCREGFKVILALPREERTIDDNPHGE